MPSIIEGTFKIAQDRALGTRAAELLLALVQREQYVGEVFSLGYETALVEIHDFHRKEVGGIPSLSFLAATRLDPTGPVEFTTEDASIILLRVMDAADLPNESEARRIRAEAAQRVSGEVTRHWDEQQVMDASTANVLSFAGIKCRVLGTFFVDTAPGSENADASTLRLYFGSDISNYYPSTTLAGSPVPSREGRPMQLVIGQMESSALERFVAQFRAVFLRQRSLHNCVQ